MLVFEVNFDQILRNKNIQKRIVFIQNDDIAVARLQSCSYGQLRQMQILQKTVQLTTFCVKRKEKYKCNFFKKMSIVCYVMLCIYDS